MSQAVNSVKDVVNIFKPEPLKGEHLAFYQNTAAVRAGSHYEFHDGLFSEIKIASTPARLLVVGHIGCGKSTELQMLAKKLSDNDFHLIIVDAIHDLDLYDFNYIDILMRIVERLAEYAKNKGLGINKKILMAFQKALSVKRVIKYLEKDAEIGAEGSLNFSTSLPLFLKAIANISASLKMASGFREELRQDIKPNIQSIVESLNVLIEHLHEQTSRPITIIIDGFEKGRYECVRRLFIEDISPLSDIKAHLVVACPITVIRSADAAVLSSYFVAPVVIPMIKTHNKDGSPYQEGINVIRELVLKRADASLFDNNALETIIAKTGGHLRQACILLSRCAFEAYMRGKETIDMESVLFTIKNYASEVFFSIENNLYQRVKAIYGGDSVARQDDELSKLLFSGIVLEYNGDRWVDLNPLVRDYINEHPGVLG